MQTKKYDLTLNEYNALQQLTRKFGKDVTLGELERNAVVDKCNTVNLPIMTNLRVSDILGEDLSKMLVYRYFTGGGFPAGWNMPIYNGWNFSAVSDVATANVQKMRDMLQKMPEFQNRIIMACATKTIEPTAFRGMGNIVYDPKYAKSEYAAGNLIILNTSNDTFETLGGWIGVGGLSTTYNAALSAPSKFAQEMIKPGILSMIKAPEKVR